MVPYKYYIESLFEQPTNSESRLVTMSVSLHSNCITLSYYSNPKHKESPS